MLTPIETQQLSQPTHSVLLADGITANVGDPIVAVDSGATAYLITATNAAASVGGVNVQVLGVIAGFTDARGGVLPQGYSGTDANQTSVATGTGQGVYAVYYELTKDIEFAMDITGTPAAGYDQVGVYFNFSASAIAKVNVAAVSRTLGSQNQVYSYGKNPANSSQIIGKIVCTDMNNVVPS